MTKFVDRSYVTPQCLDYKVQIKEFDLGPYESYKLMRLVMTEHYNAPVRSSVEFKRAKDILYFINDYRSTT